MSAATIRRGSAPARRAPAKKKARQPSLLSRAVALIPLSERGWQRLVTWTILGSGLAALAAVSIFLGLPAYAGDALAQAVGRAGFTVKRVEVTGIDRMERLTVYAVALDQESRAMPLVNLGEIRERLMQYGWIADARVSRRLPDTLVVDIVERKPAAVWQHEGQLSLIDGQGVVLEPIGANALPDLPLIIGPDANVQATALTELLARAPGVKPMLAGATWVGGRRWDLRFQSGETLSLPESDAAAATALMKFAELDARERLLGRGFVRFDMRDPAKMVVRMGKDRPAIDTPPAAEAPADNETKGEKA